MAIIICSVLLASALTATDLLCHGTSCASSNHQQPIPRLSTPYPPAWTPLPLGSLAPRGWLLEQLLIQANSLSGFLPISTFPGADAVNTSLWTGGKTVSKGTTQWLPYWSNGNVPLLLLLRAAGPAAIGRLDKTARLEEVVDGMMEYVLKHTNHSNGWIGPYTNEPGDANGHGLWDPLNMLRSLFMYAEAMPDVKEQVAQATVAHLTAEAALLQTDPVYKWASTRWPTFVQCALYVVDHYVPLYGGNRKVMPLGGAGTMALLLNASYLFREKGMDWFGYYNRSGPIKFPNGSVPNWNTNDHGVNNAEGAIAWPAMDLRLGGKGANAHASMDLVLHMLDTYQGQPNALFCADEVFCGRAPHRGTETCAVVEAMASLEQAYAVLDQPNLMDRVESLAFNALPAALTADMWTHVYVQQANSVFAGISKLGEEADPSRRHHHLHARHQPNEYPVWSRERLQHHHDHHHHDEEDGDGGVFACAAAPLDDDGGSGGNSCSTKRRLQHDRPSGEDQTANYFGVSHFPCCITNFPQGWPKFAASAILVNETRNAFVIASLLPLNATMPKAIGGGATLLINSSYPFKDVASIHVHVPSGHATTAFVRVPGWAVSATINGVSARNGTLHAVSCLSGDTIFDVVFKAAVIVERGWGVHGEPAAPPIVYNKEPHQEVVVPSDTSDDWDLSGGAGFVGSRLGPGLTDIRSGGPGGTAWLTNRHPLYGLSHNVTTLSFGFRFVAGYTSPGKLGATASVHILDMATRKDLTGPLMQWKNLSGYSFDHFKSYSPILSATVDTLQVSNSKPLLLAVKISNNQRNVQIPLSNLTFSVAWGPTAEKEPPSPVSKYLYPPSDAAIVKRGPLLFALHPEENRTIVKTYNKALPYRPKAVDYEISTHEPWAYALELSGEQEKEGGGAVVFDPTPSAGWREARPFDTESYPFSVVANVRPLSNETWGYFGGSRITAQPPQSPVDCTREKCGPRKKLRMVPFGGTNIRVSVWPWVAK